MRHHLSVDIESRSSADISRTGSYKYAQDPDFRILLFGYRLDDGPAEVIDLTQGDGRLPERIITLLQRPDVTKHAYNAQFEWYCLQRAGYDTPLEQWECTMVHAMYLGYPSGLARTGAALGLKDEDLKLSTGKALIRYFCVPNRPTRSFAGGFHSPEDDPDRWELFKEYNRRDVISESAILAILRQFPVPPAEWELWRADVRMNALGVRVDRNLIAGALTIDEESTRRLTREARQITGLDNPNSQAQLLPWLQAHGCGVSDIRKETVADQLAREDLPAETRRVLELRQLLGKTSIKKYQAMQDALGEGDRIRGISQFYGANRTGRYAGRLVQMQNLTKNHIGTLDEARRLVESGNFDDVQMIYGNVPDLLSQLIRTAFVPSDGRRFVVADFSAIEARVLAWLAGETWVSDVFASGRDIYCETASAMFGVPVEKHGANAELRQRGKVATLALGYQGGPAAMIAMGALRMGIPEEDLPDIVTKWRASRPKTVRMWYEMERAAAGCVETGKMMSPDCDGPAGRIVFQTETDMLYGARYLTMQLPVGRKLYYPDPEIKINRFDRPAIHYKGTEQTTGKWGAESTYGGKLAENCISGDAMVITSSGFVRLRDVKDNMLLWDGLEWVSHKGIIDKGIQETISVDGARMTPDHKILTTEGWKRADESSGFNRLIVQREPGALAGGNKRQILPVECEMPVLREDLRAAVGRGEKGPAEVMRLHEKRICRREDEKARDVGKADLECLALNERTLRDTDSTSLEELRRARDQSVRAVVEELRGVPGGYGPDVPQGTDARQDRRERRLLPGKLPLDHDERAGQEQARQPVYRHAERPDDCGRSIGYVRHQPDDNLLQTGSRGNGRFAVDKTKLPEQVYDIRSAGPRHRFCIMTDAGPMIVHNCVQGIARDCLCEVIRRVIAKGWDIVFHVHDEIIVDAPPEVTAADLCALMAEPIDWAPGLLLEGAGFETAYYKKD